MKINPNQFPIDQHLAEISQSLEKSSYLLIKAETGAGKTTRLPPYLLEKEAGKILVLEPRRLAAKLSAARCAEIFSEEVGQSVGHHIRFDKTVSEKTKLLFITEGLFIPYLREDPTLKDVSTIILDEFHERSLHTDIALSLIKKLKATSRPDLKLVVMSATLETEKLEKYLDSPKVFNIPGRTYPIEIEHHEMRASEAVVQMLADDRSPLNILVFLPGMGLIRSLEQELKNSLSSEIDIVPLHSSLPKGQQNKAFTGNRRKVILSTNIAETSLTIPNVTGVIDLGTERRASFAPWSGMPLLQLEKISKASATQRAGRAGRIQNGLVYRLYSEADYFQREAFTPPEIVRVELSHYLLDLMELGFSPEKIDWFEAPPEKNLKRSYELLETLGAIDEERVTDLGRYLAKLPLHPRLGAFLYATQEENLSDALLAACLISEGMVISPKAEFSGDDSDEDDICDLSLQCDLVKAHFWNQNDISDYSLSFLDKKKAKRVLDLYQSLAPRFALNKGPAKQQTKHANLIDGLLAGFPDRVAAKRIVEKKRKKIQSYNFCLGRGGKIAKQSALFATMPNFIIVLDALENPKVNAAIGTTIQAASKVSSELLKNSNSPFLSKEKESTFNEKKGTLVLSMITKYGKLTVEKESSSPVTPKGETLIELVGENWPWPFENDDELQTYNQRVKVLDRADIEHNCPLLEGEMFEIFLQSCIEEETSFQELTNKGLKKLIEDQLSPQDLYVLEHETPEEIRLANGKTVRVHYEGDGPFIQARIQDLYSITEHPHIAAGKVLLIMKLLSPANRVAQVIRDLPGFWESSWEEVKKDLKSKYPKHFWPDDPKASEPKRLASKNS